MKESVAIAKEADAKKGVSPTRSDNSIPRLRNEPERQLDTLGGVISNIRRDGGTPSIESIATQLSGMHSAQRAHALLALQRTHGNRYVQRVVAGIQAKLVVGQPGDMYEQEADRVADAVMRMPEPEVQCPEEEEDLIQTEPIVEQITPLVQRQVEEEEEEKLLQTKEVSGQSSELTSDFESRIQTLRRGGQPLPESARDFFEPRFGYDFSGVLIHTDGKAAQSARALNAMAFTAGREIVFGAGRYVPDTTEGKRLLAHEIAHVVQQTRVPEQTRSNSLASTLSSIPTQHVQCHDVRAVRPGPFPIPLGSLLGVSLSRGEVEWIFRHVHGADNPLAIRFLRNYMDGQRTRITLTESEMSEVQPRFSIQTNYVGYSENDKEENSDFWQRCGNLLISDTESISVNLTSNGFANLRGTLGIFTVHWVGNLRKEERASGIAVWHFVGQIRFTDTWDLNPSNRGGPELGVRLANLFVPGSGFPIGSVRLAASESGTSSWDRNAIPNSSCAV